MNWTSFDGNDGTFLKKTVVNPNKQRRHIITRAFSQRWLNLPRRRVGGWWQHWVCVNYCDWCVSQWQYLIHPTGTGNWSHISLDLYQIHNRHLGWRTLSSYHLKMLYSLRVFGEMSAGYLKRVLKLWLQIFRKHSFVMLCEIFILVLMLLCYIVALHKTIYILRTLESQVLGFVAVVQFVW